MGDDSGNELTSRIGSIHGQQTNLNENFWHEIDDDDEVPPKTYM